MGYVVKENVGDMDENTREGRIKGTRKKVVEYVHAVVGNNSWSEEADKFLFDCVFKFKIES